MVVEVDDSAPDLGEPPIPGRIVAAVEREVRASEPARSRPCEDVDLAVGRNVVSILPDEPTLQLGPGGIAEAIVTSVDRPVGIWSGLLTDAMADLERRGLLRGTVDRGLHVGLGADRTAGAARAGSRSSRSR